MQRVDRGCADDFVSPPDFGWERLVARLADDPDASRRLRVRCTQFRVLCEPGQGGGAASGMQFRFSNLVRGTLFVTVLPLIAACAIIPGPTGSGVGTLTPDNLVMLETEADALSGERAAQQAVRIALSRRGYRIVRDANFEVKVSIAKRATEVGFKATGDTPGDLLAPQARPEGGRLDLCREHIFRMSVAIIDRGNGSINYRGAAENVRCGELEAGNLAAMAAVALQSLQ